MSISRAALEVPLPVAVRRQYGAVTTYRRKGSHLLTASGYSPSWTGNQSKQKLEEADQAASTVRREQ